MRVAVAGPDHDSAVMSAGPDEGRLGMLRGQRGPAPRARSSCPRPGILLDRDGTIIVDHGYVGSVDRVEFIPGAAEAVASFNAAAIPVAVVTNQAGVAKGLYGLDDVRRVHEYIAERLAEHGAQIDLFVFCPYHPAGGIVEEFHTRQRGP